MQHYDAKAEDARQATDMKTAIGSGVAGIIVVGRRRSRTTSISPHSCSPTWRRTSAMAYLWAVNPLVIAPLERRDVVWKKFAAEHKWQQRFAVGKFSHAVADDNAKLATPALKTHPDVKAVFATYGIDISDADIELMTKENSPWRATATTDPSAIGAGVTRALTLELAGQLGTKRVVFPGVLVTQDFIRREQIKNMGDLRVKLPELNLAGSTSAAWMPAVNF
jgi:simple sugar transport system substrate-binding protein